MNTLSPAKSNAPDAAQPPGTVARWRSNESLLPAILALALFLGFFYHLQAVPLFDVDEGAFSEATREMLARGDFVTTWLNGQLRFDKPILIYWLQAATVALFGVHEWAFRLPSALAGCGWILSLFAFARHRTDRETAYVAAVIGATSLGVAIIGRAATADALLNLLLVLTLFDIYRYFEQPRPQSLYRAYLWMGLGLLDKGPVAVLIPFAVSGLFFLLQKQGRRWLRAVMHPAGWLLLLLVAAPWYALEYHRQGHAFIAGFLMRHNIERFQSPLQGHSGSLLYYLPVALLLVLPYSGLLVRTLPGVRHALLAPLPCFLWTWFLFVLVFFSLSGTKLPHYLLYGVTPLFLLMARHRQALHSRWLAFLPALLLAAVTLALPSLAHWVGTRQANPYLHDLLTQGNIYTTGDYLTAGLLLAAMLLLALLPRPAPWRRLLGMGLLCTFALGSLLLPAIGRLQQAPVKEAALMARKINAPVMTWGINMPSFSVYLGRPTRPGRPGPGELALTRADAISQLQPADTLFYRGGIALVRKR